MIRNLYDLKDNLFISGTLAEAEEDGEFHCKNYMYGIHADPERCDRFYVCSMKKATLHTCPTHLLLNSITRTCAIPALVNCGDRPRPGHGNNRN